MTIIMGELLHNPCVIKQARVLLLIMPLTICPLYNRWFTGGSCLERAYEHCQFDPLFYKIF